MADFRDKAMELIRAELKPARYIDTDRITKSKIALKTECKAMVCLDLGIFTDEDYAMIIAEIKAIKQ